MALQASALPHEFFYNGSRIPDPDPKMDIEQVRDLLVPSYPETATATMTGPEDTGTALRYSVSRPSAARIEPIITRHAVRAQDAGPPTLGPAQPLTTAFVESLVRSLGGEPKTEILPESVLAKTAGCSAGGHRPESGRCSTTTWKGSARVERQGLPSTALGLARERWNVEHPSVDREQTAARGYQMAVAPFWNLSDSGLVCTGSMRCPSDGSETQSS